MTSKQKTLATLGRRALGAAFRRIVPEAVRARLFPYEPRVVETASWDQAYAGGEWDRLFDVTELAHYSIIVGYFAALRPGGSVLDVGCGSGVLHRHLARVGYRRYVGVDGSEEALAAARQEAGDNARFVCGSADRYAPDEPFDAVVFNEILYYLDDPVGTVQRYARHLNPEGIVLISIFRGIGVNARRIWLGLDRVSKPHDAVQIAHPARGTWDVRAYKSFPS